MPAGGKGKRVTTSVELVSRLPSSPVHPQLSAYLQAGNTDGDSDGPCASPRLEYRPHAPWEQHLDGDGWDRAKVVVAVAGFAQLRLQVRLCLRALREGTLEITMR